MVRLLIYITLILICGCATSHEFGSDAPDRVIATSNPDPAAWAGYSMTFGKKQPKHPENKDDVFFYKHCSDTGRTDIFSRTEYWCNAR